MVCVMGCVVAEVLVLGSGLRFRVVLEVPVLV